MDKKIKLYLFTGFLGSGKTTLLKGLLDMLSLNGNEGSKKAGVVVNEFGKINIDGHIVKREGLELVEINNGSIFCKCLEGSFIEELAAFAKLPIEYLFVESSGLSDPSSMESIIQHVDKVTGGAFEFMGSLCVVDASNFTKLYLSLGTLQRQVNYSDVIILNKIDLVNDNMLQRVESKLREINPEAEIIKTSYCKLSEDFLGKPIVKASHSEVQASSNTCFNKPKISVIRTQGEISKDKLMLFIQSFKKNVFRMKGFVQLQNGLYYLDVVENEIFIEPSESSYDYSKIVIIPRPGYEIKEQVRSNWMSYIGKDAVIE